MYRCESWTITKAEYGRIDAFELSCWGRFLKSSLDYKEIKPVNPKGNQHYIFIGRIDTEAEAPILWLPDSKSQLIGKDPDAGKNWRQKQKMRWLDSITDSKDMNLSKHLEKVEDRGAWRARVHDIEKSRTGLSC